jgi:protein TonB
MTNRSLLLREGYAPHGDRLVTTAFLAAIVHAIVIAGISFTGEGGRAGPTPGLEVVLVGDDLPTAESNVDAAYLAQKAQHGGGTTRERRAARSPQSPPDVLERDGVEQPRSRGVDSVLTGTAANTDIAWTGLAGEAQQIPDEQRAQKGQRAARPPGEDAGLRAELTGPTRDELWVAPDTEASPLAPYVDAWRRKVERLGTLNFPRAARRALASGTTRNPVIEVSLKPDGALTESRIQRSSGSPQLDEAALQILRLASPFDPFPPELADRVGVLRFAYEWQFEGIVASAP